MNLLLSLIFKAAYGIAYVLTRLVIMISFQIMGFGLRTLVTGFRSFVVKRQIDAVKSAPAPRESASERPRAAPEDTAPRSSVEPQPQRSASPASEGFATTRKADVEDAIILDEASSLDDEVAVATESLTAGRLPEPRFEIPRGDGAVYATDGFSLWKVQPIQT